LSEIYLKIEYSGKDIDTLKNKVIEFEGKKYESGSMSKKELRRFAMDMYMNEEKRAYIGRGSLLYLEAKEVAERLYIERMAEEKYGKNAEYGGNIFDMQMHVLGRFNALREFKREGKELPKEVRDLEGVKHKNYYSYAMAINKQARGAVKEGSEMEKYIDSELKKQEQVNEGLKNDPKYLTKEMNKNYEYLEANWRVNLSNEEFGVEFKGKMYTTPRQYARAMYEDKEMRAHIDKEGEMHNKVRDILKREYQKQNSKDRGIEM
jgi:hypothetical protein